MTSKWVFILAVAGAVAGGATSASADTVLFTSCHIESGCGVTPFATVDLTQNGNNVGVTVSGPNMTFFASTGAMDGAYFAFNDADAITITGITFTGTNATKFPASGLTGVSGTFSGPSGAPDFGTFGFAIQCTNLAQCNGTSNTINSISFTVTNTTIAHLTQPNSTGTIFIADALVNGGTGVIDASVPAPIVGAGLPGLLAACTGLVMLGRRRRQNMV